MNLLKDRDKPRQAGFLFILRGGPLPFTQRKDVPLPSSTMKVPRDSSTPGFTRSSNRKEGDDRFCLLKMIFP